jgi:deoxyhypusine monooxygenase
MVASAMERSEALDPSIAILRKILTSESESLARRFRALFSLKYFASLKPPTVQTLPAIQSIVAAFSSQSALLKHELAYCLGQSKNPDAVSYLRHVLVDRDEDTMCRHEAAEALGALGYPESLEILKGVRDDENESDIIRETCDIAIDRILWETSKERRTERLKPRSVSNTILTLHADYLMHFFIPQ